MNQYKFYRSKAWHTVSNGYRKHVHNMCERCHRPCFRKSDPRYKRMMAEGEDVVFGVVHHKIHLTPQNINDANITLNWDNLELTCITCHNTEHMYKPVEIREDIKFDKDGRVILNGIKENIHL